MTCPTCGHGNRGGAKFCASCGSALAATCPNGHAVPAGARFCDECGATVGATTVVPAPASQPAPAAERRLVSVLFADLVGFTAASEDRDAEETRELLSRYFEEARSIIVRYGGTVEKFIGDAVMAVWGTPVAQEDDPERAVRAALDLVAAIPGLDPALRARAGVLTGEAAVTIGAQGEGMVAGDLVNTASRIQSEAEPGAVLVGESTKRASEAAVAYASAGEHELKGKSEPITLWRALRVVASRGGEGRTVGLEAPFVGRDRELRLVKDLFHATADENRASLVSVVGVAGVGKSRLSWEFEKYVDGLSQTVRWHRGRCLAYGDGVAYWALAEMVRGRIGALEDDDPATTAERLAESVAEHVPDLEERAWIEERLRHLVGLGERTAPEREDLFPAWRRFFELLAEKAPVVLVFEDLHWADAALVTFVEHVLDWSRNHPIFVLTLSRPEIAERHVGFPGVTRSATSLPLEPLPDESIDELLRGLVPGLPDDVRADVRDRADGIPLYAVETVRMLLDRGLLELAGSEYRLTGPLESLEIPETLHALIASRLDALPDDERSLVQDAAVLGKTFTRRALAALAGTTDEDVEPAATALVRKELFHVVTDPRSPERGQYGFLQALVQRVAYETLSRRERRSKHLAAATFLARESGMDPSEIAEVIAAHYLDAFEADVNAPDAAEAKASARDWFVRAAERAAGVAAPAEAQRACERAASLAADDVERAGLLRRAGELAWMAGAVAEAERHLGDAIAVFEQAGRAHEEAQASSSLADILFATGRLEDARELLERSLPIFEAGDEAAAATVLAQLGRLYFFERDRERSLDCIERALEIGERLRLLEVVSQALNTKGLLLQHRPHESIALMRGAIELARAEGLQLGRAYLNLSYLLWVTGAPNHEVERVMRDALAHARRRGDRTGEFACAAQLSGSLYEDGRWDEVEELAAELPEESRGVGNAVAFQLPAVRAVIAYHRGDGTRAAELMAEWAALERSADATLEGCRIWAQALIALVEGRNDEALTLARTRMEAPSGAAEVEGWLNLGHDAATLPDSAPALADLLRLADAADVQVPPSSAAQRTHVLARVAALRGDEAPAFAPAIALSRESGSHFRLAMALVEEGEWLVARARADDAVRSLAEARDILEPLRATPWLERVERAERILHDAKVTA